MASREEYIEAFSRIICMMARIEPVDSGDGSPNWWMFSSRVTPFVDKLIEDKIVEITDGENKPEQPDR